MPLKNKQFTFPLGKFSVRTRRVALAVGNVERKTVQSMMVIMNATIKKNANNLHILKDDWKSIENTNTQFNTWLSTLTLILAAIEDQLILSLTFSQSTYTVSSIWRNAKLSLNSTMSLKSNSVNTEKWNSKIIKLQCDCFALWSIINEHRKWDCLLYQRRELKKKARIAQCFYFAYINIVITFAAFTWRV